MAFDIDAEDVPVGFAGSDFLARKLVGDDDVLDHEALMSSRDQLRRWEQSTWPADDFTVAANREDLERHAALHDEGRAFTYTVMNPTESSCLGCIYLFPTDAPWLARAEVEPTGSAAWGDYEAAVYYWVRTALTGSAFDHRLLAWLRRWLADDWTFGPHLIVTNSEFVEQVDVIAETDLELRFRVTEPDKPNPYLAYD